MRKVLSFFLLFTLLVLSFPMTSFAKSYSENRIEELLEERAELICMENWEDVNAIDSQLEDLGVKKLTPEQIEELYNINNEITLYVSKPVSTNVTWFSERTEKTYGGVTYEIQTLTAQPNEKNSNLKMSGNRAISSSYKWKAGVMNALSVVGSSLSGEIPGASLVLSVYDTVNGFVSGISKTTEISAAEIVYTYAHTTTVSFKYVKVKGESDDRQDLTYISTKGTTAVGYQYPTFTYSGGSVSPNVIQGSRTINSAPSGYNSDLNAIKAYIDSYATSRAYVDSVQITGIESKSVSMIYPVCPEFPSHIY